MTQQASPDKKYRLTLDFTIAIDKSKIPDDPNEGYAYNETQRRLLASLLSNKEGLHEFLSYQIAGHVEGMGWQSWHTLLLGNSDPSIREALLSSIAALDQNDREHFQIAEEQNYFYESVEELQNCFSTIIDKAEIVEVQG
jgi:hypothetical protein